MIRRYILAVAVSGLAAIGLTYGTSVAAGQSASADRMQLPGVGQSRTPLTDGRWLLVGGRTDGAPVSTAALFDPATASTTPLPALHEARAWHSATTLSDGSILVLGGIGLSGHALASAERFDPATETWAPLLLPGVAARAGHTATLLTDGRVFVAGGAIDGRPSADAEMWNLETGSRTSVGGGEARVGHSASLLADGRVLISGGS